MKIQWIGDSSFKLQGKNVTVCIDPLSKKEIGKAVPKTECQIAVTTTRTLHDESLKGEPFVIDAPGEYSVQNVAIKAIAVWHDDEQGKKHGRGIAYIIRMDEIAVCHLGHIGTALTPNEIEKIGNIDILLTPVGGAPTASEKDTHDNMNNIEPRIVIPFTLIEQGEKGKAAFNNFIKEVGATDQSPEDKYVASRSTMPQDDMDVVILTPSVE